MQIYLSAQSDLQKGQRTDDKISKSLILVFELSSFLCFSSLCTAIANNMLGLFCSVDFALPNSMYVLQLFSDDIVFFFRSNVHCSLLIFPQESCLFIFVTRVEEIFALIDQDRLLVKLSAVIQLKVNKNMSVFLCKYNYQLQAEKNLHPLGQIIN